MLRRRFVQSTLAAATLGRSAGLIAAPAGTPRLLLVFLRGGYDASSLLVPTSSFYREVRPNIAIVSALPLNADWGLHPALAS